MCVVVGQLSAVQFTEIKDFRKVSPGGNDKPEIIKLTEMLRKLSKPKKSCPVCDNCL